MPSEVALDDLDRKLNSIFAGKVVRKDLLHRIKKGTNVPTFVLEFLLARYCASDDPTEIQEGMEAVLATLHENYVRPDEEMPAEQGWQAPLSLASLVLAYGYQLDSPQGYAVRLLLLIDKAKALVRANRIDEAMAVAFAVGQQFCEADTKETWEPDALRGEKVLESARSGHAQVYGTEEAKAARRQEYVRKFQNERARGLSAMAAYEAVAEQCGVSPRTIQRAVAASRSR